MITIFILLGLGLLGGGIAAIVDGLPYMVLERGFTKVIIGTVLASGGVLMLALAWVLIEIRRLKKTIAGAATAMSVISTVASPEARREPVPQAGLAGAGVGALAGAGATLTGVQALEASASPEWAEEPAEPVRAAPEPGLGRALAEPAEPAAPEQPEAARDAGALPDFLPHRTVEADDEPEALPVPEDADAEPELKLAAEPEAEAAPQATTLAQAALADEPGAEPFPAAVEEQAQAEDIEQVEAEAEADRPVSVTPGPADIEDPFAPAAVDPAARTTDEFGLLRESLAGLRLDPAPVSGRIEPTFGETGLGQKRDEERDGEKPADNLSLADSWMEPAWERRMPTFGEPEPEPDEPGSPDALRPGEPEVGLPETAGEPISVEPDVPRPTAPAPELLWPKLDMPAQELRPWPPQSREAEAFDPQPPAAAPEDKQVASADDFASVAPDVESDADAAPKADAPEAATAPEPASPAASNEGVVGAYQVGEAHFTIYADGSIQARTPDGDYSFASMDELKVYLASEKSRLGV
ncbi:hypothetical protein ASE63_01725 [Bosea sp. Root381]|uniref:hypothetical protein n=1 Tax=Bosea sp. Root381 TaxID=1736524 RepID=UPI000701706C|nr:hypothetical protein [Bosea sp. Root381]KRE17937.1 hypothetical protein ASE63_01725 [Bosea sp. Root381]